MSTLNQVQETTRVILTSMSAKLLISEGILKAVEIYQASYDAIASDEAIENARNQELNEGKPKLINFMDFYRKTLHDACLEADASLCEILFTMLDSNWNGAIEMAEECMDDATVEGQAP